MDAQEPAEAYIHTWPQTFMGVYMATRTYTATGNTGVYAHDHKGLPRHKLSQGHAKDAWLLRHVEAYMAIEVSGVIHDNRHVQRYT